MISKFYGRTYMFLVKRNYIGWIKRLTLAYICYMGNWERQQDVKKEERERDKLGREVLGKFFYDLGELTFATMVLGGMVSVFTDITK